MLKCYIKLMRVKHYIKNFLIFLPVIFSKNIFDQEKIIPCIIGFFSFSLIASAIYILNDIIDVEKDRRHPIKRNRPIASGEISIGKAIFLGIMCIILAIVIHIKEINGFALCYIVLYFILNLSYSIWLKNKPFLDVIVLVSGFVIRVLYGSILADIAISGWLYLTIISISFYMALGKRRNELKQMDQGTRQVLKFYSYEFLDKNMYMCVTIANIFYSLWAMDNENKMLITVPVILVLSMRYSYDVEREESQGDPVDILLHDKMILLLAVVYAAYLIIVLYVIK